MKKFKTKDNVYAVNTNFLEKKISVHVNFAENMCVINVGIINKENFKKVYKD
jgi:hypothetical protein